jgi:TonB family protein
MALQLGQQGSVVLLMTVDAAGVVSSVEVKQTSGSSILDHYSVDFVKRHWTVEPGAPGRLFQATIKYELVSN